MMANATENAKESVYKSIISPVLVLLVICVACGALLAWLNEQTAPLIKENELLATQQAFLDVLPEGTDANGLSNLETTTEGVESAVRTADGKAAVKAIASGYSGKDVTVYVAFDTDGIITGIQVDASTQTAGIGSKVGAPEFYEGFLGWDASGEVAAGSPVGTISGASYSSGAVFDAVNSAMTCFNQEIKGVE